MLRSIVDHAKIVDVYHTTTIFVKFLESFVNVGLTSNIGNTSNSNQELIKIDLTILISVEIFKQDLSFFLRQLNAVFSQTNIELLLIDLSISVERIEILECAA